MNDNYLKAFQPQASNRQSVQEQMGYLPEFKAVQLPGGMPTSPPPAMVPQRGIQPMRVDAGSIRNCIYHFTYIWQINGDEYWMFPTRISRTTVSGFRWNRRRGWGFFGVSLNQIASFMCR